LLNNADVFPYQGGRNEYKGYMQVDGEGVISLGDYGRIEGSSVV
jgi:hypothetical protein